MKSLLFTVCLIFFLIFTCSDDGGSGGSTSRPECVINPFGNVPMSAGIQFAPTSSGTTIATVTVSAQKGSLDLTSRYSFENSTEPQWIPIIGLYATGNKETQNEVHIIVKSESGYTILDEIYTITLPVIPTTDLGQAALEAVASPITNDFSGEEMIFVQHSISKTGFTLRPVVYDKKGNIRYYNKIKDAYMQFVIDNKLYVGYATSSSKVNCLGIYSFLGQELSSFQFTDWKDIHHCMIKNPRGNIVLTIDKNDEISPIEQFIMEFNPNAPEADRIVNTIDLSYTFPYLDKDPAEDLFPDLNPPPPQNGKEDIVHNNFISSYVYENATYYICCSQRSGIAAVNEAGLPQWYFFPQNIQSNNFFDELSGTRMPAKGQFIELPYTCPATYSNILVDPAYDDGSLIENDLLVKEGKVVEGIDFIYPFRQHGAHVVSYDDTSVTFIVVDNALFQGFETVKDPAYSRMVCYKVIFDTNPVDESNPDNTIAEYYGGKIQQLWSKQMDFFSPYMGTADSSSDHSRYLFTYGTIGSVLLSSTFVNSNDESQTVIVETDTNGMETGSIIIPENGTYSAQYIKF